VLGIKGISGSGDYYIERVAADSHDYYSGRGESPGTWSGEGLKSYGLTAGTTVTPEQMRAAMEGVSPQTGEALITGRAANGRTVKAFDLTYSAPKSVSLLYGMGSPEVGEEVKASHDAAVGDAMAYLEAHAVKTRRGRGGKDVIGTDGLIVAQFRHRSSREGDPDLHTHAVVANLVRGEDGKWSTPFGARIFTHAKTAGVVYQARLRAELIQRLGVEWGPVSKDGQADLAGILHEAIERFSKRRAQIKERMAELGTTRASAAQTAALNTRIPKQRIDHENQLPEPDLTAEGMHERWRAEARVVGLDVEAVLDHAGDHDWRALIPGAGELAETLGGPEGLTERRTSFTRRDVVQAVAREMQVGADLATIEVEADAFLASEQAVELHDASFTTKDVIRKASGGVVVADPEEGRYTSKNLLDVEAELLQRAEDRRYAGAGMADADHVRRALETRPTIGDDQRAAVTRLTRSGAGIDIITGQAGTGKTFMLEAAREAWEASGLKVLGASKAARAAQRLQDEAGIPSTTLDRLLTAAERGDGLGPNVVVVVDEAGMVGTRNLARLTRLADAGAKIALVGDAGQLPEIDAGGAFRHMGERLGTTELTENRRLRDPEQRATAIDVREGRAAQAMERLEAGGLLVTAKTAPELHGALAANWWADRSSGRDTLMMAPRVVDARSLNAEARRLRREAGEIGPDELTIITPKSRDRLGFARGDEVLFLNNNYYRHHILNGDIARVESIDADAGTMRVRFLGTGEKAGKVRTVPPEVIQAGDVDHAYAQTVHKTQGASVDNGHFLGSDALYRELGYPGLTRARDENRFYVVEATYESVQQALGESRAQEMATEQLGTPPVHEYSVPPSTPASAVEMAPQDRLRAPIEADRVPTYPEPTKENIEHLAPSAAPKDADYARPNGGRSEAHTPRQSQRSRDDDEEGSRRPTWTEVAELRRAQGLADRIRASAREAPERSQEPTPAPTPAKTPERPPESSQAIPTPQRKQGELAQPLQPPEWRDLMRQRIQAQAEQEAAQEREQAREAEAEAEQNVDTVAIAEAGDDPAWVQAVRERMAAREAERQAAREADRGMEL
jgi:conjugative relaxase-like TrwC/TraI family protein